MKYFLLSFLLLMPSILLARPINHDIYSVMLPNATAPIQIAAENVIIIELGNCNQEITLAAHLPTLIPETLTCSNDDY